MIIPWTMYLSYGDQRVLETQYDSMARWVEYDAGRSAGDDYIWDGDFHFGDWLAYRRASRRPHYPGATTGKDCIATAFFAHSTDLLRADRAASSARRTDAARYEQLLARIKEAFRREFVTETGRVGENTQTAYALALQFDLLPEEPARGGRAAAGRRTCAAAEAPDDRLRRHAVSLPRAQPLRLPRRGLLLLNQRGVSVVALSRSSRARRRSGSAGTGRSPTARSRTPA